MNLIDERCKRGDPPTSGVVPEWLSWGGSSSGGGELGRISSGGEGEGSYSPVTPRVGHCMVGVFTPRVE